MCDWPSQAKGTAKTRLTTSAAPGLLGPSTLSAPLELPAGPLPLADRTVTFTAPDGSTLCTAATDVSGDASCAASMGLAEAYTATFGGYDNESSSTAGAWRGGLRPSRSPAAAPAGTRTGHATLWQPTTTSPGKLRWPR